MRWSRWDSLVLILVSLLLLLPFYFVCFICLLFFCINKVFRCSISVRWKRRRGRINDTLVREDSISTEQSFGCRFVYEPNHAVAPFDAGVLSLWYLPGKISWLINIFYHTSSCTLHIYLTRKATITTQRVFDCTRTVVGRRAPISCIHLRKHVLSIGLKRSVWRICFG